MFTLTIEKLFPDARVPARQTEHSAGYDLYAYLTGHTIQMIRRDATMETRTIDAPHFLLLSRSRALVSLGFKGTFSPGYECQIRPRSGRAWIDGLQVFNAPGTIDADYPGEWKVMLYNATETNIKIAHGERIAQAVFSQVAAPVIEEVEQVLAVSDRQGGFGSTGEA